MAPRHRLLTRQHQGLKLLCPLPTVPFHTADYTQDGRENGQSCTRGPDWDFHSSGHWRTVWEGGASLLAWCPAGVLDGVVVVLGRIVASWVQGSVGAKAD